MKIKSQKGQSIIELLVTMALMAIILPAIIGGFISSQEGRSQEMKIRIAKEELSNALEAILLIKDKGFENISTNGLFYLTKINNSFSLTNQKSQNVNGVNTSVLIEPVYRSADQTIVSENGILDPVTKKITLTVFWDGMFQNELKTTLFLTRNSPNASFIQTLKSEFETGTLNEVKINNQDDGEITLLTNRTAGYYESSVVDLGQSTTLNTINPKVQTPLDTQVLFQLSLTDAPSDNCQDAPTSFTGPDGSPDSFYTGAQMVRFEDDGQGFENPGRCFKYRAFLTSQNSANSPIFESFQVNFSQ
jgi:type II secretory pathway pseudopilin PulG